MNYVPKRAKALRAYVFACLLLVSDCAALHAQNQDSVSLTIPAAEKIFLQKNLTLLAAKYNVDANKALIEQAKLWDNPTLSTDQNIYDQQGGFFKHNNQLGTFYVQVEQLIKTAGKRSKLAQLSMDNTSIADAQFNDVLRSLHYTLVSDMLEVHRLLKVKEVYDGEIAEMNKLVAGMDTQLNAGNISLKDFTRLKALLFGLQNEVANVQADLLPVQQELKLLLQTNDSPFIKPELSYQFGEFTTMDFPSRQSLIDSANALRPDASIDKLLLDYNNHNLVYQKALAKPDVTLGLNYDQRSNYANNYVGFQVGLPIPLLNRNQGSIKSARIQIQQQQTVLDQTTGRIANEVSAALDKVQFYQQLNNKQQLEFSNQYDMLFNNMVKSFQQRQVNLLEFIDFIDNYKDTKLKLIEQHNGLVNAIANLNYSVNKEVVPVQ